MRCFCNIELWMLSMNYIDDIQSDGWFRHLLCRRMFLQIEFQSSVERRVDWNHSFKIQLNQHSSWPYDYENLCHIRNWYLLIFKDENVQRKDSCVIDDHRVLDQTKWIIQLRLNLQVALYVGEWSLEAYHKSLRQEDRQVLHPPGQTFQAVATENLQLFQRFPLPVHRLVAVLFSFRPGTRQMRKGL